MNTFFLLVIALLLLVAFVTVAVQVYDPSLSKEDRAARRERNEKGVR